MTLPTLNSPEAESGKAGPAEKLLIAGLLFLYSQDLVLLFMNPPGTNADFFDPTAASLVTIRSIRLLSYLIFLGIVVLNFNKVKRLLVQNWILALLLLYVASSCLWSLQPATSAMRSISLAAAACFGFWLALRLTLRELLSMTALVLAVSMALSYVIIIFLPALGTSAPPHEGAWRGVFMHRNSLGAMMFLNLFIIALLLADRTRWTLLLIVDFILSLILLIFSGAKSPVIISVGVVTTVGLVVLVRKNRTYLLPGVIFLVVMIVLLSLNVESILNLFGRDATLTGRTRLWSVLASLIREKWLFGYGYEAFWVDNIGPLRRVVGAINYQPPHAHNQFIEVWLGLGLVGLLIFAALFISTCARVWNRLFDKDFLLATWTSGFLVNVVLHSLSEDYLLDAYLLSWPLFVATLVYVQSSPRAHPVRPMLTQWVTRDGTVVRSTG
jgi:exopolysaccharide production protein ExoQ